MRRTWLRFAGSLLLSIVTASCGDSKTIQGSPGSPTPTPGTPSPSASLSRVLISGGVPLTQIGATAQFLATAVYSDGATQDVTQSALWFTSDPRVASVSAGRVTVVAFGQTFISVNYSGRGGSVTVNATPAGTFVVSGGVREPGQGPLANVEVIEALSGHSTTTRDSGGFSFGDIRTSTVRFAVRKAAYEPIDVEASTNSSIAATFVDLPIQKIIRFAAGEKVSPPRLAPNDVAYTIQGTRCDPCRLIRVVVTTPGTVHFRFTWPGALTLSLFARDLLATSRSPLEADALLSDPGEHIFYFGSMATSGIGPAGSPHIDFTIETTMP